jgi:hypothetical protein
MIIIMNPPDIRFAAAAFAAAVAVYCLFVAIEGFD